MHSKRLFSIAIMLAFSLTLINFCFGQTYWHKTYPGSPSIQAIQSIKDGNFLIVGFTENYKGLVMKIKPNGDTICSKTFGKASYNSLLSIEVTADGNYLIVGNEDADGWLVKINQSGDTLWSKTYNRETFYSIHTSNDGNFLIIGAKDSGDTATYGFVMKVKPDGAIIWSNTYHRKYSNDFRSIQPSGDGNFLLTGSTSDSSESLGWLVKIKPNGDTVWSKTYGRNPASFIYSIQSSNDGNFFLAGSINNGQDGWVVKVNTNGDTIWTRTYNKNVFDDFFAIQTTGDNNFMLTGTTQSGNTASGWLVKIKPNGDTIWTKTVGKTGITDFRAIKSTSDGNFLVAGAGNTSVLFLISDQYAYKNSKFTYKIPVYSNDTLNFGYAPLKVPSEMKVSPGGTVSWTPNTDSVYMEHAEFLVFNDIGRKDTLTFNIFVNSDYKTQILPRTITTSKTVAMPFDITIKSSSGYVKFYLPSGAGTLNIYDIKGRIVDKITPAESSSRTGISWPGDRPNRSAIQTGKYLVKASMGNMSTAKMFTLIK